MSLQTPPRPGEVPPVETLAPPRGRPWVLGVVAMAVVVVLGLALVLFRPGANEEADRPGSAAPAAPTEQDKQAVVDAYLAYLRVALESDRPPESRLAELRNYATDRAYESVANAIQENQRKGIVTRPGPSGRKQYKVEVVSITGDNAVARDCRVDDGVVVERATGKVVDDEVVTDLTTVFLVRAADGRWKVSAARVEQRWAGVAGCAPT